MSESSSGGLESLGPAAAFQAKLLMELAEAKAKNDKRKDLPPALRDIAEPFMDSTAAGALGVLACALKTEHSSKQPQDPLVIEAQQTGAADFSFQYVPIQSVQPVRHEGRSVAVQNEYVNLEANLVQQSTGVLRLASRPFKDAGDVVGLMVHIFGPEASNISSVTAQATFIKIIGLASAIVDGARLEALGPNCSIHHDSFRTPVSGSHLPILLPPELSDVAKGMIACALLPSRELMVLHGADRRFMHAFFRHDLPGTSHMVVANERPIPLAGNVNSVREAHNVLAWSRRLLGDGLFNKIVNTCSAMSTVYGPIPVPANANRTRICKASPQRVAQVPWAQPNEGVQPQPGVAEAVDFPAPVEAPAQAAIPVYRLGASDFSLPLREPRQGDAEDIARARFALADCAGATLRGTRFERGQGGNPYALVVAQPGRLIMQWAVDENAPAGAEIPQQNPLVINVALINGQIPQWVGRAQPQFERLFLAITGPDMNRFAYPDTLANYVPPDATRDRGLRDCYGLIAARSQETFPAYEQIGVGPLLSGFVSIVRTAKPPPWPSLLADSYRPNFRYRGRLTHLTFAAARSLYLQDPAQCNDNGMTGREITQRFRAGYSTYSGPQLINRENDPGAGIELMESPLLLRLVRSELPAVRVGGGAFLVKQQGRSNLVGVLENNRQALDSALRACGAQGDLGQIAFRTEPRVQCLAVDLADAQAQAAGRSIIANFALPATIDSEADDAKVPVQLSVSGRARDFFSGDTSHIQTRIS
jgi:hypothetical protein